MPVVVVGMTVTTRMKLRKLSSVPNFLSVVVFIKSKSMHSKSTV